MTMSSLIPALPVRRRITVARAISAFLIRHSFWGAHRMRSAIARVLMPRPRGPLIVRTTFGCSVVVDASLGRGVEHEVYYHGTYEAGTLRVLETVLRPGDIFLDIGANIGLMTLAAARVVGPQGRVYAFEPVSSTLALLKRNLELNDFQNVHPQPTALGSARETRPIYEHLEVNRGAASLVPSGASPTGVFVPVTTLDSFVRAARLEGRIRAVKIDVEGWEAEVLAGGRDTFAAPAGPAVIVEYSTNVQLAKGVHTDVYDFLASVSDYRVFCLKRGKESVSRIREIRGRGDLPAEDNLICLRPVHLQEANIRALLAGREVE